MVLDCRFKEKHFCFRFKDVDSLDVKPDVNSVEFWRNKFIEEQKVVRAQRAEIDKLKHEILQLKLAKEKARKRTSNEL